MSIHLDKQESVGHTQVVEGTYPRDNISREEWGEVTGKGRRGRGQSSGTDLQEEYRSFLGHFLLAPACQTNGTLRPSPWITGL